MEKGDVVVKFKATIWKTGGSFVVTVPRAYIDDGQFEHGKEYLVELSSPETEKEVAKE